MWGPKSDLVSKASKSVESTMGRKNILKTKNTSLRPEYRNTLSVLLASITSKSAVFYQFMQQSRTTQVTKSIRNSFSRIFASGLTKTSVLGLTRTSLSNSFPNSKSTK